MMDGLETLKDGSTLIMENKNGKLILAGYTTEKDTIEYITFFIENREGYQYYVNKHFFSELDKALYDFTHRKLPEYFWYKWNYLTLH